MVLDTVEFDGDRRSDRGEINGSPKKDRPGVRFN